MSDERSALTRIRACLAIVIAGLIASGITAFPLRTELTLVSREAETSMPGSGFAGWLYTVHTALDWNYRHFPFMAYGTDWLAFAHLVIAIAFLGPWRDPVRNRWIVDWGLIACACVIPFALIAGSIRGIPFGWRLIDCSFGVFGSIPLFVCRGAIRRLETRAL